MLSWYKSNSFFTVLFVLLSLIHNFIITVIYFLAGRNPFYHQYTVISKKIMNTPSKHKHPNHAFLTLRFCWLPECWLHIHIHYFDACMLFCFQIIYQYHEKLFKITPWVSADLSSSSVCCKWSIQISFQLPLFSGDITSRTTFASFCNIQLFH